MGGKGCSIFDCIGGWERICKIKCGGGVQGFEKSVKKCGGGVKSAVFNMTLKEKNVGVG